MQSTSAPCVSRQIAIAICTSVCPDAALAYESMSSRGAKLACVGGGKAVSKRTFHARSQDDLDFDSFDVETLRAYARHAREKERALLGYYELCVAGPADDFINEIMHELEPDEFKETFGLELGEDGPEETVRAIASSVFEPPVKKSKLAAESDENSGKDDS